MRFSLTFAFHTNLWGGRKLVAALLCISALDAWAGEHTNQKERVGVLYVVHGAARDQNFSHFFDAAIQIASYDPNSPLYKGVIWNPDNWSKVLPLADLERAAPLLGLYRKYNFEFGRLGNIQPATRVTEAQTVALRRELEAAGEQSGTEYVVDWVSWIAGSDDIERLPYPRFVYNRAGQSDVAVTYCGQASDGGVQPDGRWPQCDPQRYDVDGPMERMLREGVDRIILIDTTVGGVRFSKTYDVQRMLERARDDALQGTGRVVPIIWANDYTGLMRQSYPTAPAGWTKSLGPPEVDPKVPLQGRPNPVTDSPEFAALFAEGLFKAMSTDTPPESTGVLLFNHGIYPGNEFFDPKIDDTVRLHEQVQRVLLQRYPGMSPDNIVGGWEGLKEKVDGRLERTRAMRGEDIGHAFVYEKNEEMPAGKWGLRYWDALQRLKDNGVKHIVVAFPQVLVTTTVGQVGLPNQVAKEIGYKGFRPPGDTSVLLWPGFNSPFADHWPPDVELVCRNEPTAEGGSSSHECCYKLSGCMGGGTYPETRQTPLSKPLQRTDPSLVFDVPAYGHLGYDPSKGLLNNDAPVQDQYTGTWSIWVPIDNDPRLAQHLAKVVVDVQQEQQEAGR